MEGKKPSASSFASDFFGSTESTPSGLFGYIFAPESKVQEKETLHYSVEKKPESFRQESNSKSPADNYTMTKEEEKRTTATTNNYKNSYFQEQKLQPCPLSSSIYYGGQDLYAYPQKSQDYRYTNYNNIDGEDDTGSASRGNWWQGSLYY